MLLQKWRGVAKISSSSERGTTETLKPQHGKGRGKTVQHFFTKESYKTGDLHLWAGPLGVHLFWPDFWHSRIDWCWGWKKEEVDECGVAEIVGSVNRAHRIVESVKPKNLAPALVMAGLAGACLPMIADTLAASGLS
jgi:hypothetical protein